jgi:phospholipid-binding lipoprotein MlaA
MLPAFPAPGPFSQRAPRLGALASVARVALPVLLALLAGCASIPPNAGKNPADPFERVNRQVDAFNYQVDRIALKPTAQAYQKYVPRPVRNCVSNFFNNLSDVPNTLNNLLQGKVGEAAADACRVVLNSTIGLGGCFDVARTMGLPRSNEDFGQTLGRWGAGPGAYLVIPLLGPSDVRDALGKVVDFETDPLAYVRPVTWVYVGGAVRLVDTRANLLQASDLLEGAALDRYSFTRDAYLQHRRSVVYDGNPPPLDDDDPDPPSDQKGGQPSGDEATAPPAKAPTTPDPAGAAPVQPAPAK